ncbi:hypothetical protein QWY81_09730 [Polaribacter undariae]|uniref:DUF4157 domain-containing protein n=1 Tax=Polaribacter sejongensis TaxID=985043 RepID=A0AAJ1QX61_9FLAO|nr:hypothetical protein [Polaribacter undariae]MDN3619732.1 hypothetical protein [Polaribacter undariae]UWD31498.1 hypothetical protein NQP51_15340 [Polaribacter undariae]
MILITKYLIPKGFVGITLFPFILLKKKDLKDDKVLVNHEKIHLKQQAELLLIFFFIFYSLEWILKFLRHKNGYLAYKNLSFEREAYQNENNFNYIKNRKFWAFIKYF